MVDKPLIFISCGQFTQDEISLGKQISHLIETETPYEAYFAEQQNTLEGLSSHILSALDRAAAFIGVMHERGTIDTPTGEKVTRGSVWVEQELAIAAFIQNVLGRRLDVALYLQAGITREGIRSQLRLAPTEFSCAADVLDDLRRRLVGWNLSASQSPSLIAEIEYELQRPYTGDRHRYKLKIYLFNNGPVMVNEWYAEIWFPTLYLEHGSHSDPFEHIKFSDTDISAAERRLFPGRRLWLHSIDYVITPENWPGAPGWTGRPYVPPRLKIVVGSATAPPWELEMSMKDLQDF
jgi:hypothetical protein